MKKAAGVSTLTVVIVVSLFVCSGASAQTTVGQLAPPNPTAFCQYGPYDSVPFGPAAGAYTVPADGVITAWSTNAAAGDGQQLMLKVFRPPPPGSENYVVVGHDGPHALIASTVNTFKSSISVKAGDLIGVNSVNPIAAPNACVFETGNSSDALAIREGNAPDGGTFTPEIVEKGVRANVTATILPPPTISAVSPSSGSVAGGTGVVISGTNFAEVTSAAFGNVPAASFSVDSETQVTAIAPAAATSSSVGLTVTTPAGRATSAQLFTYTQPSIACVVPKLRHKQLKAAKKALLKAHCRIGKVKKLKGAEAKTGRVAKQKPRPGQVLAPGSKVGVTLRS